MRGRGEDAPLAQASATKRTHAPMRSRRAELTIACVAVQSATTVTARQRTETKHVGARCNLARGAFHARRRASRGILASAGLAHVSGSLRMVQRRQVALHLRCFFKQIVSMRLECSSGRAQRQSRQQQSIVKRWQAARGSQPSGSDRRHPFPDLTCLLQSRSATGQSASAASNLQVYAR